MAKLAEYERFMKELCEALGHQHRHVGVSNYSLSKDSKRVVPVTRYGQSLTSSLRSDSVSHRRTNHQSGASSESILAVLNS